MDKREEFEEWAKRMGYADEFDVPLMKHAAREGWQARQPQIDALNNALIAEQDHNADMVAEVINLKAEVERLEGANALNKNALRLAREENERLRKDAERYRWIRANADAFVWGFVDYLGEDEISADRVNEYVDAGMEETK